MYMINLLNNAKVFCEDYIYFYYQYYVYIHPTFRSWTWARQTESVNYLSNSKD